MPRLVKIIILTLASLLLLGGIFSALLYRSAVRRQTVGETNQVISGKLVFPAKTEGSRFPDEVQIILTLPNRQAESSQYLTILMTGLFTLLGSCIVLIYNFVATSSTRKFEWAKHIWETYQESYLDLRNTISLTRDPNLLRGKMELLSKKIFLPAKLERDFTDLIEFLQGSESTDAKEKRARAALVEFEAFVRQPWKYL